MSFPKHLRQLTRQIQNLIADPKVFEHWQTCVSEWAQSERTKSRLEDVEVPDGHGGTLIQTYYRDTEFYLLPDQPSWEYRFAILSAVNDAVVAETKDETGITINPFPAKLANRGSGKTKAARETESKLVVESAAYCVLRSRIGEITEEEGELLLDYLEEVQRAQDKPDEESGHREGEALPGAGSRIIQERESVQKQEEAAIPKILPENRTKPMSYKDAAKHLGKGRSKDAGEWLSACVAEGTIRYENITRQSHIFDKTQFPKDCWPIICPSSGSTDPT